MKSRVIFSAFIGLIAGIGTYIAFCFIDKPLAIWSALIGFSVVTLFLYTDMLICCELEERIVRKFESGLKTEIHVVGKFSAILTRENKSIDQSFIYISDYKIILMTIKHRKPQTVTIERGDINSLELRKDMRVALGTKPFGKLLFLLTEYNDLFEQLKLWMAKG